MLAHYLSVALRNILRTPFAAVVNVLTLSLGLACFVTADAIVGFWNRSEQHFANANRTFVVTTEVETRDGNIDTGAMLASSWHFAKYLTADYPRIEATARVRVMNENAAISHGDRAVRLLAVAADPEFLDVFDFTFLRGSRDALREPRSVVLTEEAAQRLFGDEEPIGQTVSLGGIVDGTVTGVIETVPEPSHMGRSTSALLRFDMLSSQDLHEVFVRIGTGGRTTDELPENWFNAGVVTYVLLPADGSLTSANLAAQLDDFARRHVPEQAQRFAEIEFGIVPVTALLGMAGNSAVFLRQSGASVSSVLLLLGALVLAVACVNYANLATARATGRTKEVGLRKTIGARGGQIMTQYLLEAGVVTTAALVVALAIVRLIVPVVDSLTGIDLRLSLLAGFGSWLALTVLAVVVTLAAGAYPAFVLSRVRPLAALRTGRLQIGPRVLPTLLVGVQFAIGTFLLIALSIIYLQNEELKRTGLGIAAEPLLVVENYSDITRVSNDTLIEQLQALAQVTAVTAMGQPPWRDRFTMAFATTPEDAAVQRTASAYRIGYDFFSTLDIPLLAGRTFARERGEDSAAPAPGQPTNIVIDRTFAHEIGFDSPADAVEELIYSGPQRPMRVIGVAEDRPLNIAGGLTPTAATAYSLGDAAIGTSIPFLIVRISGDDVSGALTGIDALWTRLVPHVAINRRFVDEYFNESYENFARINQAFAALASFALLIATIGLFAMALLIANRRAHEIGVRKTLGGNTRQMLALLLKSFSKPVVIASLAAWPLAYLAARAYLSVFIRPIELTPAPFVVCFVFTLAIAWVAVGGHTWRAAARKPADVLRSE
jgi:putative ABC transport system permease protein